MRISRREVILIAVCVVVVASIGVPSWKQLGSVGGGRSAEDLARTRDRALAESVRLKREMASFEREVKEMTWAAPPDQLPPVLLKELHSVASRAGVTLAGFRPGRVVAVAYGGKLPVTVQIRAPFPKAAAFLERLRAEQGRVALERLRFAATDAGSDVVSLELRLAVYTAAAVAESK